ncbi:peptidoglycan-binding domain-containing protein [Streptomyces thermoalcalitolerans]|uniref:Peptidoglycan binding-like domain-containing protein n=1 Tax=Streptomyces thermoalcalitolerans TaxID=65605 RepID=A0ABN1NWE2_9ACTN
MRQHGLLTLGAGLCAAAALGLAAPHPALAAPDSCSYTSPTHQPTLTHGDTGAAVKQAQCLSNMWGGEPPKLPLDGVFDSVMLKKIKWIQGCHGLPQNGVIKDRTWQVLYHPALDCYDPYPV